MLPSKMTEGWMVSRARNLSPEEHQRLIEEFEAEGLAPSDARVLARQEQSKLMAANLSKKGARPRDRTVG